MWIGQSFQTFTLVIVSWNPSEYVWSSIANGHCPRVLLVQREKQENLNTHTQQNSNYWWVLCRHLHNKKICTTSSGSIDIKHTVGNLINCTLVLSFKALIMSLLASTLAMCPGYPVSVVWTQNYLQLFSNFRNMKIFYPTQHGKEMQHSTLNDLHHHILALVQQTTTVSKPSSAHTFKTPWTIVS